MILSLIASIVVSTNSVTFTAVSTDCGLDAQIDYSRYDANNDGVIDIFDLGLLKRLLLS